MRAAILTNLIAGKHVNVFSNSDAIGFKPVHLLMFVVEDKQTQMMVMLDTNEHLAFIITNKPLYTGNGMVESAIDDAWLITSGSGAYDQGQTISLRPALERSYNNP